MFQKIEDLINERFANGDGSYDKYDENDVYIGDAIEKLFKEEGFEEDEFSVECDILFSNPAIDVGYLSIAYVDWGKLQHTVYLIERQ